MTKLHPRKKKILDIYGKEPATLDELAECTIAVIEALPTRSSSSKQSSIPLKVVGFRWEIRWSETVSNSHDCPLNGVTNWGNRNADAPSSYPGWTGRVWIRYNRLPDSSGSDGFENTLTHTGTGGFGSYDGPWKAIASAHHHAYGHKNKKSEPNVYSWDYRFFAADWPGVSENEVKRRNWAVLQNKKYEDKHTFMWEDADTKTADTEFLNNYQKLQVKK